MTELKTAAQLAPAFQVQPATILEWHRRGWIPGFRAGRRPVLFDYEEVLAALRERGQAPVPTDPAAVEE